MNALLALALLAADDPDPPERAARVTEGDLLLQAVDGEWAALERNRPIVVGDRLCAQGDARSEIDLGTGRLWLDYAACVEFTRFDADNVGVTVEQGSVRYWKRGDADVLTLTADGREIVVAGMGKGRIDRASALTVTVDEGTATVRIGGVGYELERGETFTLLGGSVRVVDDVRSTDELDEWVFSHRLESESDRYVSTTVAGRAELDRYGVWQQTSDYGSVWFPASVAEDWAPYRYGHWVSTASYGYTWIDDAPWGYAPFHYGRWVRVNARWGWCPGQRVVHVAYAPALVVLVALAAEIAWAPLGYQQAYVPAYHCSPRYRAVLNRSFASAVVYDSPHTLPGWTRVPPHVFHAARPIRNVEIVTRPPPPVHVTPLLPPRRIVPMTPPHRAPPPLAMIRPRIERAPVLTPRPRTFEVTVPHRQEITERPRWESVRPSEPPRRAEMPQRTEVQRPHHYEVIDRPRVEPTRPQFVPPVVPQRVEPRPRYVPPVVPQRVAPRPQLTPAQVVPQRIEPRPQIAPVTSPRPTFQPSRPVMTPAPQVARPRQPVVIPAPSPAPRIQPARPIVRVR